ncbi:hypothetical protein TRFO_36275 [Tritrichomonas foetus]|uniref:Uncharacterized protein n=1 Tax=Tritrichomonas foetus TaxID=1144522 RepID=A0A1J4JJV0_9EUKA|nr:hypothetical protein TRFO_36275 [Tritrichomonas foetus]|eukprot:OHS97516.1 hypothetical protein TRFO_36275 [Tritrichomonas foetus]
MFTVHDGIIDFFDGDNFSITLPLGSAYSTKTSMTDSFKYFVSLHPKNNGKIIWKIVNGFRSKDFAMISLFEKFRENDLNFRVTLYVIFFRSHKKFLRLFNSTNDLINLLFSFVFV